MTVRFSPTSEGPVAGGLEIQSDDPDEATLTVDVSGEGVLCDEDGICEAGEDCSTCPTDCASGVSPGAECGNGICEAGDSESCISCPDDCLGKQEVASRVGSAAAIPWRPDLLRNWRRVAVLCWYSWHFSLRKRGSRCAPAVPT